MVGSVTISKQADQQPSHSLIMILLQFMMNMRETLILYEDPDKLILIIYVINWEGKKSCMALSQDVYYNFCPVMSIPLRRASSVSEIQLSIFSVSLFYS
jgi:hypothetical protein